MGFRREENRNKISIGSNGDESAPLSYHQISDTSEFEESASTVDAQLQFFFYLWISLQNITKHDAQLL